MAKAASVSLNKFTAAVNAAVKSAAAKHPKFQLPETNAISLGYLIRGIPIPDGVLSKVTISEAQSVATDIANGIAQSGVEAFGAGRAGTVRGAVLSVGGHVILGIPAQPDITEVEP